METRAPTISLLNSFLFSPKHVGRENNNSSSNPKDTINFSTNKPTSETKNLTTQTTSLVIETLEEIENGYRRTQEFIKSDGKKFTRIEEFTTSSNQSRRTIVQQNPSGSNTLLEDIYDRKVDGNFRHTKRFIDEAGITKTEINPDFTPQSPDVILGRNPRLEQQSATALTRGNEIDITT